MEQNGPIDPLRRLHEEMINRDLLEQNNRDFNAFKSAVSDKKGRERLYDLLKSEGWGVHDFDTFEKSLFPVPEPVKKKEPTGQDLSGSLSSQTPAPAPIADTPSSTGEPEIKATPPNSLLREFGNQAGPNVGAGPSRLEVPGVLTGDESIADVGSNIRRGKEDDFDLKEKRSYVNPKIKANRDFENISMYAKQASEQTLAADQRLQQKFGKDWQVEAQKASVAVRAKQENAADVEYAAAANDLLRAINADPDFDVWRKGQNALAAAQTEYQGYSKKHPEYAQYNAMEMVRKTMAENPTTAIGNWAMGKGVKVAAGIASLPRTLLGTATKDARTGAALKQSDLYGWAQEMGNWADAAIADAAAILPTGEATNRPMWEKTAAFEGVDVVVDDKGRPVRTMKNGKDFVPDADFDQRFIQSGAAANAKSTFTGARNAGFKLADTVADLYLMRSMGGGSMAGTTAVAFGLAHQDAYNTAINDLALSGDDASTYALVSAGLSGLIEATIGSLETQPLKLAAAKAIGLKEAKALVGKASAYDIAKAAFKPYLEAVAGENVEELVDNMSQAMNNQVFNAMKGSSLDTDVSPENIAETIVMTTLATSIAGGGDAMRGGVSQMYKNSLNVAVQNPEAFNGVVDQLVQGGVISQEQADVQRGRISRLAEINAALPTGITEEKRQEAIALEDQRMTIMGVPAVSEAQVAARNQQVKDVEKQIVQVITEPNNGESQTEMAGEPTDQQEQDETGVVDDTGSDRENVDSVQPNTNTDQGEGVGAQEQAVVKPTMLDVFTGKYDENPFERPVTEDHVGQSRLVPQEARVEAGVPEYGQVVTQRNTPISEVVAAYGNTETAIESLIDDATNVALNALTPQQRQTVQATPALMLRLQTDMEAVVSREWQQENGSQPFVPTIEAMAQDFADEQLVVEADTRLRNRFEPVTVDDHIAAAFADGVRVRPGDIAGDVADAATGSVRLKYTDRNGTPVDLLAQDILASMGGNQDAAVDMSEQDVLNAIYSFIDANPNGPGEYMRSQIAARSMEREDTSEVPVEASDMEDAVEVESNLTDTEVEELEGFMDQYGDDYGRMVDDWMAYDPFEETPANIAIRNLSPKIYTLIDDKLKQNKSDDQVGEDVSQEPGGVLQQAETEPGDERTEEEVGESKEGATERNTVVERNPDGAPILPVPVVEMGESGGVVRGGEAYADLLSSAGATFDLEQNAWTFNADQADAIRAALSERRSDGSTAFDALQKGAEAGGMVGSVMAVLSNPGAALHRYMTKKRLSVAKTLDDRLAAAQAMHQISRSRDERTMRRTIKRLAAAFPNIEIVTDRVLYERAKRELGITGMPLGFTYAGKVYVDATIARPDTPIHEFGHIWNTWLRENKPDVYAEGERLAKESDILTWVKSQPAYRDKSEADQIDEVISTAIGQRGATMGSSPLVLRTKLWLSDMWSAVQRAFGFEARHMTLKEFADYQAMQMLAGKPLMSETSRRIKMLESADALVRDQADMTKRMNVAIAMEQAGESLEKIFVTTGWIRSSDGFWRWGVDSSTFDMKVDATSEFDANTGTLGDVVDWPALYEQYPELKDMPVAEFGDQYLSPSIVYSAQAKMIEGMREATDTGPLAQMGPEESTVIAGTPAPEPRFQVNMASAEYAARIASARDIVVAEIRQDGLKDVDVKAKKIAGDLNLDLNHVYRLFEQETARIATGRLVLTRADVEGGVPSFKERLLKKATIRYGLIKKWGKRKFTTFGLLPRELFMLDQKRLGRIAARIQEGEWLLRDLEREMEAHYGKRPNDAQWTLVDNVIRGEGDWSLLPENIRGVAKQIRAYTDTLSKELLRSGVMQGDVVLTTLKNAGIEMEQAQLENWDGVNVFEALQKLPFERTDAENAGIESFLENNADAVGTYLYRSYRKYDDPKWIEKVQIDHPRVWGEAKRFLEGQIRSQIAEVEQSRTDKADELQEQIDGVQREMQAILDGIEADIKAAEGKISDIESAQAKSIAERGRRNQVLDASYAKAVKALRDLKKRSQQVSQRLDADDAAIMADLEDAGFQNLSVAAKKVIKKRRKIMELQDRIEATKTWKQDVIDQYYHNLQNVEALMVRDILDVEKMGNQLSRAKLGAKDINILKGRKDIAAPIRELMGEYHDPRVNFAKSMFRMVNLLENQRFLTDMREHYRGVYFLPPNELRDGFVKISSEGSEAMAPLNGWQTTKDIREALNTYFAPSKKGRDAWERVFEFYTKATAFVKYGKTIVSPQTHGRNFVGNIYFVINNAYNPYTSKAKLAFQQAWFGLKNVEDRAYVQKLIELRVLANGSYIGSIKELLGTLNGDSIDQLLESRLAGTGNKVREKIEDTYQAEDDFFRIIAFETEKARYSNAWYDRPYDELTPAQKSAVDQHAAGLVQALMPTYSMVPEIVRDIQRFPLTGTFVAFPAEMFRVAWNQWKQIGNDLADPRTRGIGMQRLLGTMIAQVGLTVGSTLLGYWRAGIGWDEDKAARRFMFPWQDNGTLVYTDYEPGKMLRFINLSYTNPYSFQSKPLAALFLNYGKPWKQKVKEAGWNLVEPFLSPELTASTIGQLAYNINERTGRPIYNEGLGFFGDWENSKRFLTWNLQPGASKFILDTYSAVTGKPIGNRTPKELSDVLLGLAGFQVERVDLEKAVTSKLIAHRNEKQDARDVFTQSKFNYKNDPEGLKRRFELSVQEYNDALKEAGLSVDAAAVMGFDPRMMQALLKDKGFSAAERAAIMNGGEIIPTFEGYNK